MPTLSEPAVRAAFRALAALHLALGAWMILSPHSFFTTLGSFGSYNAHYERDAATFYLAFAAGAGLAVGRPRWRIPVLGMITVQYVAHTLNHLWDAGRSHNGWAGPLDVATLGLAALQFAGLLWLVTRTSELTA